MEKRRVEKSHSGPPSASRSQSKAYTSNNYGYSRANYGNEAKDKKKPDRPTSSELSHKKDATDVQQIEKKLLQLMDDFQTGKLKAFGKDSRLRQMEEIREQQETLARMHFDVGAEQDLYQPLSEDGLRISEKNMKTLMEKLAQLSESIENLHSNTHSDKRSSDPDKRSSGERSSSISNHSPPHVPQDTCLPSTSGVSGHPSTSTASGHSDTSTVCPPSTSTASGHSDTSTVCPPSISSTSTVSGHPNTSTVTCPPSISSVICPPSTSTVGGHPVKSHTTKSKDGMETKDSDNCQALGSPTSKEMCSSSEASQENARKLSSPRIRK